MHVLSWPAARREGLQFTADFCLSREAETDPKLPICISIERCFRGLSCDKFERKGIELLGES